MDKNLKKISAELQVSYGQVEATAQLLDEGATIPFIARYRKEVTGSLDEVALSTIRDRMEQLRELDKRRETVLNSITEQGKMTDELRTRIEAAETMAELEDIYLPYKPKRRTRATIAREKGLEPLSLMLLAQNQFDIEAEAARFVGGEQQAATVEEALAGARDIIAELVNEDPDARREVRQVFEKEGAFTCKVIPGKETEGQKYRDYFEWSEPIKSAPSHRILAMRRGEKEGILSLDCAPPEESSIMVLEQRFVRGRSRAAEQVQMAVKDAYKRLLKPSMETEIRLMTKIKADEDAIRVFADNLRQLLLASPLGQKRVLALDPGFRTGCKVVCLDNQGKLLYDGVIYPHEPQRKTREAGELIRKLLEEYRIDAVAIGNGTAGRETENFVKSLKLSPRIQVVVVNESGASVYSASEVARNEFPEKDITVRGAVSIGRRLMDPLAELVKIDPKSIGVGQYQHDVDQGALKKSLDDTVISCVNAVGVDVNTASKELLTYVSGLNSSIAKNIVGFRDENGPFSSREDLKKINRLGEKAFQQCAGFLRIRGAKHPLDASAVHPESYPIVEQMAKDLQCTVQDLMNSAELRRQVDLQKYVGGNIGLPTLQDIMAELAKPGRDPREQFEAFSFAEGVEKPEDLKVGMKLPGLVTNITDFGAFVDIGVHQDGLVHLSQIANRYIKHPSEVLKVAQKVEVTVTEVDLPRKRIALSMLEDGANAKPSAPKGKNATPPRGEKPSQKPAKSRAPEPEMSYEDMIAKLKNKFR